jgi:hypothetical protein
MYPVRRGPCPLDCPLTVVLRVSSVPLLENQSKQNTRQCYSYSVNFALRIRRLGVRISSGAPDLSAAVRQRRPGVRVGVTDLAGHLGGVMQGLAMAGVSGAAVRLQDRTRPNALSCRWQCAPADQHSGHGAARDPCEALPGWGGAASAVVKMRRRFGCPIAR